MHVCFLLTILLTPLGLCELGDLGKLELDELDKPDGLGKLNGLGKRDKLDELGKLDERHKLDELGKLDGLGKLDKLDKCDERNELGKLDEPHKLNELGKFDESHKLDELDGGTIVRLLSCDLFWLSMLELDGLREIDELSKLEGSIAHLLCCVLSRLKEQFIFRSIEGRSKVPLSSIWHQ